MDFHLYDLIYPMAAVVSVIYGGAVDLDADLLLLSPAKEDSRGKQ